MSNKPLLDKYRSNPEYNGLVLRYCASDFEGTLEEYKGSLAAPLSAGPRRPSLVKEKTKVNTPQWSDYYYDE